MTARLLTTILLLLAASATEAQQRPNGPPPRAPAQPALAPPAATQMNAADRQAVLRAAAAWLRGGADAAGQDSVVFDPRYHSSAGSVDHLRGAEHAHKMIPADELAILRAGLRGRTAARESVLTCDSPDGCVLTVPRFLVIGEPVLRSDGTATVAVELWYNHPSSTRGPTFMGYDVMLFRGEGGTWTVKGNWLNVIS